MNPELGVKDESELSEVLVSVMIPPDSRLRALKLFMILRLRVAQKVSAF